jgi:GTP cyclohydrolase I
MNTNLAHSTLDIQSPYSIEADQVRHALIEKGLETPLLPHLYERDEKYQLIKRSFSDIDRTLGLDLNDDSLSETPHRIAKMYVEEMVKVSDISLTSLGRHLMVNYMVTAFSAACSGDIVAVRV